MHNLVVLAVVEKDLELIRRARAIVEMARGVFKLARSGEEALLYLRGVGVYQDREIYPLPSCMLLDTQGEGGSDLDVVGWIREHIEFLGIPLLWCSEHLSRHQPVIFAVDARCLIVDREQLEPLREVLAGEPFAGAELTGQAGGEWRWNAAVEAARLAGPRHDQTADIHQQLR